MAASASAMTALTQQLKEMMMCKVCFDEKEDQKQLPCQHTLCLTCLNKLSVSVDRKYKCPTCNQVGVWGYCSEYLSLTNHVGSAELFLFGRNRRQILLQLNSDCFGLTGPQLAGNWLAIISGVASPTKKGTAY